MLFPLPSALELLTSGKTVRRLETVKVCRSGMSRKEQVRKVKPRHSVQPITFQTTALIVPIPVTAIYHRKEPKHAHVCRVLPGFSLVKVETATESLVNVGMSSRRSRAALLKHPKAPSLWAQVSSWLKPPFRHTSSGFSMGLGFFLLPLVTPSWNHLSG